MKFSDFAIFLDRLEKTPLRNEMTRILAELFKKAGEEEIDKICYLALGELVPSYRGIEFNIAEKLMFRILAKAYDVSPEKAAKLFKERGDLGNIAGILAEGRDHVKKISDLSVEKVYDKMIGIAQDSGTGSQERKIKNMAELLNSLDPLSARFVARIPVGRLRLGFSDATILDALSVMERGDKSARTMIERAYNVTADIGAIAKRVKRGGIKSLSHLEIKPGVPIRSALAERVPTIEEIMEKLGPVVAVEPKLDGFRTAIHVWREDGKKHVALFSRNLENTTPMFPEIVKSAGELSAHNVILDGEAIGFNPKTGKFMPFQETVQRKRKYDIEAMAKKIPLTVFVFDILYLNDRSLLDLPFSERRKILEKIFSGWRGGALRLAAQKLTADSKVVAEELKKAVEAGLEGLVIKNLNLPYEAGSRGFHWVKFKPTTAALGKERAGEKSGGLLDTVDCVVMGAYRGRGKRAAFGVGGFLLGVRGRDGRYYTISRLGTGLSDEQFREANRRLNVLKAKDKPKDYVTIKEEVPDIWVRPSLVVEILADEMTPSPRHTAGRKEGRGYSLRFPRLVRFRDDKNAEDVTTVSEIEKMYKAQKRSR